MKSSVVLAFAFVLVPFFFACAPAAPPVPTTDLHAIQTQAALSVFATETASVPTATATPTVTNTPRPTLTPLPTQTPTLAPSPTPMPTIVVPAGWKTYTAITGKFSLAYPPDWTVQDQKTDYVIFQNKSRFTTVGVWLDNFVFSGDWAQDADTFTT